jgi:excisionase family DNA binding protein
VYLFIIIHLCCTFVIFSVYTMELSLQQAVEILGKTRRQVLYMIEQGRLPAKKIGGCWVIDRTDLQVDPAGETNEDPRAYPS